MSEEQSPQERQPRTRNVPRNLKPYFLGFLTKGERWNDPQGSEDLQAKQLAFLREQMDAGSYIVAGPVTDGGELTGFAIIASANMEEARTIIGKDPAVQSGRLRAEVRPAFLPSLNGVKVDF